MQIAPSPMLASLIRHFLIIESDYPSRHRIFSDGNTGIVFNFGDGLLHENPVTGEMTMLPRSFAYGQLEQYQHVVSTGKIRMIIVVLHAYAASALLGIPAFELKNYLLDLRHFFREDTDHWLEKFSGTSDARIQCNWIEDFLIEKTGMPAPAQSLAGQAVHLIHKHQGILPIGTLISQLQVSERKLQRVFDEEIGLSPKHYSGIIRLQRFLKLLRRNTPSETMTMQVYECGFYDQTHLIREMKHLSGITPRQYISQKTLAANFLQIPA
jgi:AraC-like DNA-binding protein